LGAAGLTTRSCVQQKADRDRKGYYITVIPAPQGFSRAIAPGHGPIAKLLSRALPAQSAAVSPSDTVLTVRCPYCRENDDKVVDSRTGEDGTAIRRRRECLACGRRFTTYERLDEHGLVVRKRDDTREPFDRDKLRDGLERAASGRLEAPALEALASGIEEQLRAEGGEIGSDRIGVTVLEQLRGLDHVAYLRFASVYKGFEDLSDFEREVVELQKTTEPKRRHPN
jgi:transcriptional repressor NrdR